MATKKQPAVAAIIPVEGEVLPNLDVSKAGGTLITVHNAGIGEITEGYRALTGGRTDEQLAGYAATIDGNSEMKAFLKLCSSQRTSLDKAHKDAKAPFLNAGRIIDAKLKELKGQVTGMEDVIKAALTAYEDKEKAAAAAKQKELDDELARLREENAKLRGAVEEAGILTPFIEKQLSTTVRGSAAVRAVRGLFGDGYDDVATDENGVNYVLELVLRRKEQQEV